MLDQETKIQETLIKSQETLGDAVPRLILENPQVATHGLTHGLTGRYTFLTLSDLAQYAAIAATYFKDMRPAGIMETQLLQRIIDTGWRLSRIPNLAEDLRHTTGLNHLTTLMEKHPAEDLQALEPYARAGAFQEGSDDLLKLARYETSLNRNMNLMSKEFTRLQAVRLATPDTPRFQLEESVAYREYFKLCTLAKDLIEARKELAKKSTVVVDPPYRDDESISSRHSLVRKNLLKIVTPLTKTAVETFQSARDWGLLTELERTMPLELRVA